MEIVIRQEKPTEFRETENVIREAFWNVYEAGCTEHYLMHVMRTNPAFVTPLNLVAVADERIIGHVANVKGCIEGDDGNRHEVLTLGPISVLPQFQRMGIGSKLISEVKRLAENMGFNAILLCGNPDFYMKLEFVAAERYCIRNAENMFMDALLACELKKGALKDMAGRYSEDAVYNIDKRVALEYDKGFPPKERLSGTISQRQFLELVARCHPFVRE